MTMMLEGHRYFVTLTAQYHIRCCCPQTLLIQTTISNQQRILLQTVLIFFSVLFENRFFYAIFSICTFYFWLQIWQLKAVPAAHSFALRFLLLLLSLRNESPSLLKI